MQNDILFNNIYLGHSVEDANKLKSETFDIKRPVEEALEKAQKGENEAAGSSRVASFRADPVGYVRKQLNLFINLAKIDIVQAVKIVPEVPGAVVTLLLGALAVLIGLGSKKSTPAPVAGAAKKSATGAGKEKKEDKKDKAVTSATGAEKDDATKRK